MLQHDLMDLVFYVTCQILGIDASKNPQNIRPLYPVPNPAALRNPHNDMVFYLAQFGDAPINRQIDVTTEGAGTDTITQITKHVRSLTFNWQLYGDNGMENADKIRIGLMRPDVQNMLEQNNISLIPDIPEPVYVPELIGMQWYSRYDLSANFNQLVIDTSTLSTIASADVVIETEKGVVNKCSTSAQ